MSSFLPLSNQIIDPRRQQEGALWDLVKDTPFGQPSMHDGVDFSLLTLGEMQRIGRLQQQHEQLIAER